MKFLNRLTFLPIGMAAFLERRLKKIPAVKKEIEHQTGDILGELQGMVKPYCGKYESFTRLPAEGKPQADIIAEISKR